MRVIGKSWSEKPKFANTREWKDLPRFVSLGLESQPLSGFKSTVAYHVANVIFHVIRRNPTVFFQKLTAFRIKPRSN
jgi:hypothetical protein